MKNKIVTKKFKKLEEYYNKFLQLQYQDIEDIHVLRTKSREFLSLISKENSAYNSIKKVVKLSNEIRDIDIFITVFLKKFTKKHKNILEINTILKELKSLRNEHLEPLNSYIFSLSLQKKQNWILCDNKEQNIIQSTQLHSLSQRELHTYRIYIKKTLYIYKNIYPFKKQTIENLTKIKDYLGAINDNLNAIDRLSHLSVTNEIFELVKRYIVKENKKYFKKIKTIDLIL